MARCSRSILKLGSSVQPSQGCLALAFQFSIVILKLLSSSPPPPSRMKKPPAGLGGLSALSGWVLTVYLHKYLSPSYAACLCDSLCLFIFPPAARLADCCSPMYDVCQGRCHQPWVLLDALHAWARVHITLAHPLLLPFGTSLEIKCVTRRVMFSPGYQDKTHLTPLFTPRQLSLAEESEASPRTTVPARVIGKGDVCGSRAV